MTTCTPDTHATIKQLEDAGMDSSQAEAVVAAISRSEAELAAKAEIAEVKTTIARLETSMRRAGIAIAGVAVLLNRVLDWLTR